ncbi:MAG: DUF3568 family protein [Candidatus Omnitrophica bacterium]|nr:DUF3568 family protein [Candidatus Omnitrophota bacterium]
MMKCPLRHVAAGVVLLTFVVIGSGCVPLVIGSAVSLSVEEHDKKYIPGEYKNGILIKKVKGSPMQVYDAVRMAFRKLKMSIVRENHDLHYAALLSEFSDGREVIVNIEQIENFVSKVKIKIGPQGDQQYSDFLMQTIMKEL